MRLKPTASWAFLFIFSTSFPAAYDLRKAYAQSGPDNPTPAAVELSEVDEPPRIVKRVDPHFPPTRFGKKKGKIVLRFIVTKEGEVTEASVIESGLKGSFDKYALEAVKKWQFKPAIKDGKPVDVVIIAPLKFDPTPGSFAKMSRKAKILYSQGNIHFGKGEYRKALDSFNRLMELTAEAEVLNARGLTYKKLGMYEKAIDDYDMAITLEYDMPEIYLNCGVAYTELRLFKHALRDFSHFISLRSDDPTGHVARGILHIRNGNQEEACLDFHRACELGNCSRLVRAKENGMCMDQP